MDDNCGEWVESMGVVSGCGCKDVLYSLDQTPRLLSISSHNFVRLLFKSGYYSRVAFIKLSGISKIFCKCKGFEKSQFYKINKELRCGDLVLKQNFRILAIFIYVYTSSRTSCT